MQLSCALFGFALISLWASACATADRSSAQRGPDNLKQKELFQLQTGVAIQKKNLFYLFLYLHNSPLMTVAMVTVPVVSGNQRLFLEPMVARSLSARRG